MGGHTDDHKARNNLLKTTRRYQQLWKFYRPLFQASLIARYLRENTGAPTYAVFPQYMPSTAVKDRVLGHYLKQIEKSASALAAAAGQEFQIGEASSS